MVCLGTPGMCSLVNTGVHICLVGEVFSQYVLVWGYCITKRGLVLRFLAVPYRMRREAYFAEMAPQARLMLSFFSGKTREYLCPSRKPKSEERCSQANLLLR